jgi:hypothetical protein
MAYYGIPSAGIALTAGSDNDNIGVMGLGATTVTAQTIFGGAGNDVINFGANGITASLTAVRSGTNTVTTAIGLSATLNGPSFDSFSITSADVSGISTTVSSTNAILTSVAAVTTIDSAFIQANAGNDTIALGTSLTRITASQIKAGAGNDYIGFGTYIRDTFATGSTDSVSVKATTLVGGSGNDTIVLDGDNTFTGFEISAGAGNDSINFASAHVFSARVGMGAGNDSLIGDLGQIEQVSIKGGSGNDTIHVNFAQSATIGGDTLDATVGVADGNDSIVLGDTISATKIYGGGGNDIVQISGADLENSGNLINMGAGRDTINLSAASVSIVSATIRMGADNDLFSIADDSVQVISSNIKLGAGNDTIKFTTGTTQSIGVTGFSATTIFGNAGADLLFDSADVAADAVLKPTFGYNTADSTIAGYDTIAIGGGAITGITYNINVNQGSLSQLQLATANYTASNSVVTFTSTFSQEVTARVEALDATTSKGEVALFTETNTNLGYLFVQGGTTGTSDDTLVQLGTASINGFLDGHLTISGTSKSLVDITVGN